MTVAFDQIAESYDDLWTHTAIGQLQRAAFWRHVGPLFTPGQTILDLGCGTGEDALHLSARGIKVIATDGSPEMVRVARSRGVDARLCRIEDIAGIDESFNGVISNFGALNCVESLPDLREDLARLIGPGGYFAACVLGRFCLWESIWYSLHGNVRKATRRWGGKTSSSLGLTVYYPTVRHIRAALSPKFTLTQTTGIGICVPPSFVRGLSAGFLKHLGRIDSVIAKRREFRAISDHRLLVFRRS
jgi:ubiquinone/menaquinone biosynthesis C-methylase UbiE